MCVDSGFSGKVVQNPAIFNDGRCTSPNSLLKNSIIAYPGEEQHKQLFQSSKRNPRAVKKGKHPKNTTKIMFEGLSHAHTKITRVVKHIELMSPEYQDERWSYAAIDLDLLG